MLYKCNTVFFLYKKFINKISIKFIPKKKKKNQTYPCLFEIDMSWLIFILVVIAMYLNVPTNE